MAENDPKLRRSLLLLQRRPAPSGRAVSASPPVRFWWTQTQFDPVEALPLALDSGFVNGLFLWAQSDVEDSALAWLDTIADTLAAHRSTPVVLVRDLWGEDAGPFQTADTFFDSAWYVARLRKLRADAASRGWRCGIDCEAYGSESYVKAIVKRELSSEEYAALDQAVRTAVATCGPADWIAPGILPVPRVCSWYRHAYRALATLGSFQAAEHTFYDYDPATLVDMIDGVDQHYSLFGAFVVPDDVDPAALPEPCYTLAALFARRARWNPFGVWLWLGAGTEVVPGAGVNSLNVAEGLLALGRRSGT